MIYVSAFIASGLVVVLAGNALARYADAIAEATKLGRLWIGSVLLAGATSLPELATDISAVRLGATDLAVADLFGSSMANMLILAVIDLLPPLQSSRGEPMPPCSDCMSVRPGCRTKAVHRARFQRNEASC